MGTARCPALGPTPTPTPTLGPGLVVLDPGRLTTVQDLGRPGHAHEGVPPSGALDLPSHRLANRLAGNDPTAATLEITLGGLAVTLEGPGPARAIAVTGAPTPLLVGGQPAPLYLPVGVRPGETLVLGTPGHGLRSYLAVAGGIAVATTLGSRSTDLLSGLGPPPLRAGDHLPLGPPPPGPPPPGLDVAAAASPAAAGTAARPSVVALHPGPRPDALAPGGWETLTSAAWVVAPASNRVGLRLAGPALRTVSGELPPEGMATGGVQVPPGGQPVVFLADHPVTGGYPVVGVVDAEADLARLAQLRPGSVLRLAVGASPPATP